MIAREVRKWGVDFGNVLVQNLSKEQQVEIARICAHENIVKNPDTLENFLLKNSQLVTDALYGLKRLVEQNGARNVYIISRASHEESYINGILFRLHGILQYAGLFIDNIYICKQRSDKVDICEKLGILSFVDDRGKVLSYMCGKIPHLIWFAPTKKELDLWSANLGGRVVRVNS